MTLRRMTFTGMTLRMTFTITAFLTATFNVTAFSEKDIHKNETEQNGDIIEMFKF